MFKISYESAKFFEILFSIANLEKISKFFEELPFSFEAFSEINNLQDAPKNINYLSVQRTLEDKFSKATGGKKGLIKIENCSEMGLYKVSLISSSLVGFAIFHFLIEVCSISTLEKCRELNKKSLKVKTAHYAESFKRFSTLTLDSDGVSIRFSDENERQIRIERSENFFYVERETLVLFNDIFNFTGECFKNFRSVLERFKSLPYSPASNFLGAENTVSSTHTYRTITTTLNCQPPSDKRSLESEETQDEIPSKRTKLEIDALYSSAMKFFEEQNYQEACREFLLILEEDANLLNSEKKIKIYFSLSRLFSGEIGDLERDFEKAQHYLIKIQEQENDSFIQENPEFFLCQYLSQEDNEKKKHFLDLGKNKIQLKIDLEEDIDSKKYWEEYLRRFNEEARSFPAQDEIRYNFSI